VYAACSLGQQQRDTARPVPHAPGAQEALDEHGVAAAVLDAYQLEVGNPAACTVAVLERLLDVPLAHVAAQLEQHPAASRRGRVRPAQPSCAARQLGDELQHAVPALL
jgi:hypothetical protein